MSNSTKSFAINCCFIVITLMTFSCDNSKTKQETGKMPGVTEVSVPTTKSDVPVDSSLMFTNIEQVEYCLPLPLNEYTEDFYKSDVKAKHVFKHNTKKDNEIKLQGMFRDDPSVSIEDYFMKRFESSEEQGEIVEKKEILKAKNCFYAQGYMSNLIDKYRFIEVVWLRKDEVIVYSASFDVADTTLWNERLKHLTNSTSNCN
ncbi:MAG: hypothetical protein JNJ40_01455 [Bacteroidia bacterium]|nr:hypothetical protein [Bacteroidia bacterium]